MFCGVAEIRNAESPVAGKDRGGGVRLPDRKLTREKESRRCSRVQLHIPTSEKKNTMNTERFKEVLAQARHETCKVIIGQHDVIDKALIAILTGNHALIEGVPGVAKTLLVRTLAQVLGCE